MIDPFIRGKAWFLYNRLERDFMKTTTYVALETVHNDVWSERFGELLIRTGDMVDSFFRYMINSKSLDNKDTVEKLRKKIREKRQTDPNWHPNINDFRKAFNPIFQFSSVELEASYGLTYYGELQPFKDFARSSPVWWESYNKVKHEIFEQIERKATLENCINALAGLFILNILHKESQGYLIRYTNVITFPHQSKAQMEKHLMKSMMGIPKEFRNWEVVAGTPLFTHFFRVDEKVEANDIYISDENLEESY